MVKDYLQKENGANKLLSLVFLIAFFGFFNSQTLTAQTTENITTTGAGTWYVPCGVTSITVEAWGGGGAGGGSSVNTNGGSGGGSGAYVSRTFTVTEFQAIAYTIGTGGNGVTGGNGNAGNPTTILGMTAGGGTGGFANSGAFGIGGTASGGTTNTNGNNGTLATIGASLGGNGGDAPNGGTGGLGRSNTNGDPGIAPGAGGGGGERANSGGSRNRAGGAGARGEIRITYTSTCPSYCSSVAVNNGFNDGITRVQFNTIDNTSSANAGNEYSDFTYLNTSVQQTSSYNLNVWVNTDGNYTQAQMAWIDWNQNGDFTDPGEEYNLGTATNVANGLSSSCPVSVSVPVTALTGTTRMRVQSRYVTPGTPCLSGFDGETEDYSIIVTPAPVCTTPTAAPTGLSLTAGTPNGTTIDGSFTAATPAPDSYLVVMSTSNTPPTPVDGTTYTIGGNLGVGYTIIDTDSNTTFTAGGLAPSTTYYFFIYSMNALCSGGPLYYSTPLTGNATTGTTLPTYCTPLTSNAADGLYISRVRFVGTLNDVTNTSTFAGGAPIGFQDFTGLAGKAIQAQGEAVNLITTSDGNSLPRGTWKAWVDWNKNGVFTDAGEEVYNIFGFVGKDAVFGFKIPDGTPPGDYRIRVRVNNSIYVTSPPPTANEGYGYDFTPCDNFNAQNSETQYGEAEDYLFTVISNCDARITSVTDGEICGTGSVTLNATATAGSTSYSWYANETGGAALATTASGTWNTPSISTTTTYWVTANNGSCESIVRTKVLAIVNPIPSLTFTPSTPEICGEDNIISITASGDTEITHLIDEKFDSGIGVFSNINTDANNASIDAITMWQNQTSVYIPTSNVWFPAISSGFGANSFAVAYSDANPRPTNDIDNYLTLTSSVNSNTFLDLTLKLKMYYKRYFDDGVNPADEYVTIELSTNGGTTYPVTLATFTSNQGLASRFVELTYDLSAYINQPNLKIRIHHHSMASATGWLSDGVAVDDIELYGTTPLSTSFDWTSALPVDAYQDLACTIPYTTGTPAVTVYIKPTLAQLEQGSYTFTASAILSNGCSASDDVTINNKSKVWKGTNSNDWNDPNNWSPLGVPDITNCVIIPDVSSTNYSNIGGASYDAFGKTLQVLDNGDLQLRSGNTITIEDFVEVEPLGVFNIENSGSLIQINNVANTGSITMDRNAVTNNILDYVYWSTPVAGFDVSSITPSSSFVYQWEPTVATAYAGDFGIWTAASGAMTTGRGYIIRGSSGISTFDGVPNNGDITTPISRSTYTGADYAGPTATPVTADDDNWNLLGNPYPSAISADDFLTVNNGNLDQFVKIWTHGIDPAAIADPFYQDFVLNYDVADYITYNALGGTQSGFDGYIGAGQGFFVLMNDAASTSENATFTNSMRSNTYRNDQFYRNTAGEIEKHRIWLKLVAPNGSSSDALVGYATDASNEFDTKYDANAGGVKSTFEIYSIVEDKALAIQGKALPFDENDKVQLGVSIPENGIYTIAINNTDGIFKNDQNIYLEDLELGIIHDIKNAPYTFSGTTGQHHNRFVLRYYGNALNENTFENNNIYVYTNETLNIASHSETIKEVTVFDLLGRTIYNNKNVDSKEISINEITKSQSGLIINVTLENNETKTFKTIF